MEKDSNATRNSSEESEETNNDNDNEEFEWPHCHKVFKHKSSFCRHKATMCDTVKKYDCSQCDKSFDRPDSLKRHIEKCKGKDKVWKCDKCSKEFSYKCHLQRHLEACILQCDTCWKKVGSDGNHVCAGIKIRLPNKGRGAKKVKDTKSNEETSSSLQYEVPEILPYLVECVLLLEIGSSHVGIDFEINAVRPGPSNRYSREEMKLTKVRFDFTSFHPSSPPLNDNVAF